MHGNVPRRILVAAAALGIAGALALAAPATSLATRSSETAARSGGPSTEPPDWLAGITAEHRQLFDMPAVNDGVPLIHMQNYYDTWNRAYGVKDADIDAVGALYGGTTLYGVNDEMWAKYHIGEVLKANDPATGQPAVANPWRTNPTILGGSMPTASIESLQKRGATFIVCDNALTFFSGAIAKAQNLQPQAVHDDLAANLLPGVILVPGMVVAIEQAHRAGLSYHRQ